MSLLNVISEALLIRMQVPHFKQGRLKKLKQPRAAPFCLPQVIEGTSLQQP
jgi:hypothetical protein